MGFISSEDKIKKENNELLMKYSKENNYDGLEYFINNSDIDINYKNEYGDSLLHVVSKLGYDKIAELLIKYKADVNIINFDHNTPIHLASFYNNKNIVKMLISNGSNVDNKNCAGCTPLYLAIKDKNYKIATILIENGANIEDIDYTTFDYETRNILNKLKEKIEKENNDLLMKYTIKNNVNGLSKLLENNKNIDINYQNDNKDDSALHYACRQDYEKIVELLIKYKIDVNVINADGNTPLHIAVIHSNINIIFLLLKNGANIKHKNNDGRTPLCLSNIINREKIERILKEKKEKKEKEKKEKEEKEEKKEEEKDIEKDIENKKTINERKVPNIEEIKEEIIKLEEFNNAMKKYLSLLDENKKLLSQINL